MLETCDKESIVYINCGDVLKENDIKRFISNI